MNMNKIPTVTEALPDLMPRIRAVVTRYAQARDIDDLTQECCVRLIEKEALWNPERGSLGSWAAAIARNLAFSRQRRPQKERPLEAAGDPEAPADTTIDEERVGWILSQMATLPKVHRTALHGRYFEGKTTGELATEWGISQPAASKRVRKAVAEVTRRARLQGLLSMLLPPQLALKLSGASQMKWTTSLLASAAAVSLSCGFFLPDDDTHLVANVDTLPQTTFTATRDTPLDPASNTLWCATAPLAWQTYMEHLGGPVQLEGDPEIARRLNGAPSASLLIDDRFHVSHCGSLQNGIVEKIQKELQDKFQRGRDPVLDAVASQLQPWDAVAYSFLAKDLEFETPYDRLDDPMSFTGADGKTTPIACFGVKEWFEDAERHARLKDQTTLQVNAERENEDQYLARIRAANGDEIVLTLMPPQATLQDTIDVAVSACGTWTERTIGHDMSLRIPRFDFHLEHTYSELSNRRVLNGTDPNERIIKAIQMIQFRMDEQGARLRSRSLMSLIMSAAHLKRAHFPFNRPFLLMLRETGTTQPYFAMWVANPEILIRED